MFGFLEAGAGAALLQDGDRHHNVAEELLGVGLIAAGVSDMLNAASESGHPHHSHHHPHHSHHHHHHDPHHHHRSRHEHVHTASYQQQFIPPSITIVDPASEQRRQEAAAAAQRAAEERRLAELKREAERQRIFQEQQRQLEAQRKAQEEKEDKEERVRLAIFDEHLELIREGDESNLKNLEDNIKELKPLTHPIPRFRKSQKQGIPKQIDGKTLFHTVILLPEWGNKIKLLDLLFNRGYADYYLSLITEPLLDHLIRDPQYHNLIATLYTSYLDSNKNATTIKKILAEEPKLWSFLILEKKYDLQSLFKKLLQVNSSPDALISYLLNFWLPRLNNAEEISDWNNQIQEAIKTKIVFAKYADLILQAAQQRIVNLDLSSEGQPGASPAVASNDKVKKFLKTRPAGTSWCCFQSSYEMREKLLKNSPKANQKNQARKEKLETEISHQLSQDLHVSTKFRLS